MAEWHGGRRGKGGEGREGRAQREEGRGRETDGRLAAIGQRRRRPLPSAALGVSRRLLSSRSSAGPPLRSCSLLSLPSCFQPLRLDPMFPFSDHLSVIVSPPAPSQRRPRPCRVRHLARAPMHPRLQPPTAVRLSTELPSVHIARTAELPQPLSSSLHPPPGPHPAGIPFDQLSALAVEVTQTGPVTTISSPGLPLTWQTPEGKCKQPPQGVINSLQTSVEASYS